MVHPTHGRLHLNLRKRIHKKLEPYPHPDKFKNFMDKAVFVVGFFGLFMTIPQITKIWLDQNAAGLSVVSWIAYLVVAITWVLYGLIHKEKPIIVIYSVWIMFHVMIITGISLYG